jgi:pimeloyl-ACP methyl ester carboxylesterase
MRIFAYLQIRVYATLIRLVKTSLNCAESVPSLVIQGDPDFPHIRERSRYMATAMPNCSYQEITGTAHLSNLEQPEHITHLLTTFIDRCDRAPMFEKGR